jgi:hypothetical protein
MKTLISLATLAACLCVTPAWAKLPVPPQTDEAKAKAAEAAAKAAHAGKVEAYKLCKSQEKTAAHYFRTTKADPKSVTATAPCADPGAYVSPTAAAPAPAAAPPAAAAPAKDGKKS